MAWYSLYKFCKLFVVQLLDRENVEENKIYERLSAAELKKLLADISAYRPSVGFRCRQAGEMWMKRHNQIMSVNQESLVLYDDKETKYTMIDINNIMQFDIDERFQSYHPHHHYTVEAVKELI